MSLISIDTNKCKRDNFCVDACPVGILVKVDKSTPTTNPEREKICIGCGHCIAVCPHDALSWNQIDPLSLIPIQKKWTIEPEAVEHLLRSRRSIRSYKDQPIPRQLLTRLIETACWGPSAINLQPVHWLVIENKEEVHRLAGVIAETFRKSNLAQARLMVDAWDQGKDMILRNAPHLVITHTANDGMDHTEDCTIALTYLELAAHGHGLGTCWAGVLNFAARQNPSLVESLGLPKGHLLHGAMMIGYSRYKYHKIPKRKPARIEWRP
jgi:nitroreductase/NAD-dependent dihydropyrimidine dehydrogenase PreA subunit